MVPGAPPPRGLLPCPLLCAGLGTAALPVRRLCRLRVKGQLIILAPPVGRGLQQRLQGLLSQPLRQQGSYQDRLVWSPKKMV